MKTLLMVVSLFLVACTGGPEFPEIHPAGIKPSVDKAWPCEITDKENLQFKCSKTSVPLKDAGLEGGYCFPAKDVKAMVNFGREAKQYFKDNCQ